MIQIVKVEIVTLLASRMKLNSSSVKLDRLIDDKRQGLEPDLGSCLRGEVAIGNCCGEVPICDYRGDGVMKQRLAIVCSSFEGRQRDSSSQGEVVMKRIEVLLPIDELGTRGAEEGRRSAATDSVLGDAILVEE